MPVPRFFGAGYTPFIVNQLVLENCASVDEAIEFIANLPKQQGATYMVADKDKAAFIETVPSPYAPGAVAEIFEDGVSYHTNHYLYEPFYSWVLEDGFGYMGTPSYVRYDRAAELVAEAGHVVTPELVASFTRDLEPFGKGHVTDVYAAQREVPSSAWSNGWPGFSISNTRTVSSTAFVMGKEHPELLSEMGMAMYNPSYSAYTPLHIAMLQNIEMSRDGPEVYVDGKGWQTAANLRDSQTYDWGELYPDLELWESAALDATAANEAFAIDLLGDGKPAAAAAYPPWSVRRKGSAFRRTLRPPGA